MFRVWLVYLYKLPTQTKLVFFLNYEEQHVLLSPENSLSIVMRTARSYGTTMSKEYLKTA
jgi:hypothetical protein